MTTPRILATSAQIVSLGLAALVTSGMLLSLSAQADERHADALVITRSLQATHGQQLCGESVRAARS